MPERVCEHNTKALQCSRLTMAQIRKLHSNFYTNNNKKDQDAMILKFCSTNPVMYKSQFKGKKQTTTKYAVYVNQDGKNKKLPICRNFFLEIFGITKHRVAFVMQSFFRDGVLRNESRGGNHKDNKYRDQKTSVHNFIQNLKCVDAHYCRKTKDAERKYLSSELNTTKLYHLYTQSEYLNPNVKLSYFRQIFNNCYNIGFGAPQTDACSKCLELSNKIKSETDFNKKNVLMTEKRVHRLRAKAFFEKLQEEVESLKIISFDCQKNLPLPKVPDQMAYYSRQLYLFNFTMVEGSSRQPLSKQKIFSYVCTENEFNKDSNLVASAVYHRLTNTDKTNITTIRLVADGCGGQNKNCIVVGACCKWLLGNHNIKSIEIVFPVTGHSYMPADRVFGVIEKKLKKLDIIIHPDNIKEIIAETATLVELGKDCPVSNWRDSCKNVIKPTTSWPFAFKECKRFILKRSKKAGSVLVRGELFYKSDVAKAVNVCKRHKNIAMIVPEITPPIVAVNKNKLNDIKKLLSKHFGTEWADLPSLQFYKELLGSQESLPAVSVIQDYCEETLDDATELRV